MGAWKEQKRAVERDWRARKDAFNLRLREAKALRPAKWSPWSRREGEAPRRVFGWRVWMLPVFLWPLMLDIPAEIVMGRPHRLVGSVVGLTLAWMAAWRMARGTEGDARRGALMMGAAAGVVAGISAGLPPPMAVLIGAGAWLGTRLVTQDLSESEVPVAPEPEPEPVAEPVRPARPDRLVGPRAQLARIAGAAPQLPHGAQLLEAAGAMQGVVDDLEARPARLHDARRFLSVHLDGLSRIVDRLEAGAEPPETMPALLTELTASARRLRGELRSAESEALDIQVKVLAERLRQEER